MTHVEGAGVPTSVTDHDGNDDRVSVLGLGLMGSALARTLARAGCRVTVWNRTAARAEALRASGCDVKPTPAQAVAASPLSLLCVLDEEAVDEVLASPGVAQALAGRTLANLSTERVTAARTHARLVRDAGGIPLDGGILAYPRSIGSPEAVILYSGEKDAFARHADVLALLAGGQRHVGSGDVDATVLYGACWNYYYGGLGGFFEAAACAQAAGVPIRELRPLIVGMHAQLLDGVSDASDRLATGNFAGDQADVDGHIDGVATFVADARAAGIPADVLDAFVRHCRRAAARGYGGNDIATVARALSEGERPQQHHG